MGEDNANNTNTICCRPYRIHTALNNETSVRDFPTSVGAGRVHRPQFALLFDPSQDTLMEGLLLLGRRAQVALRHLAGGG